MLVTSSLKTVLIPTAVALGNFDGVHRGHQRVIQPVLASTPEESFSRSPALSLLPKNERIYATVVTFNPHPQEFFTGQTRMLLTPPVEKVRQMRSLGVDQLVLLPFDRQLAELSPAEFVEKILVQHLQARRISIGEDFHFGKARSGTAADLSAIAATYGIALTVVPLQTSDGERISSSCIREALQQGDLQRANQLLGRSYSLTGIVISGQQLGRTIGFPTANLQLPPEKFLPRNGVYCVKVLIQKPTVDWELDIGDWQEPCSVSHPIFGVMNIGCRPTVDGINSTVEVHLLDWSGDLYGETLTVGIEQFLRPEQKFASLDDLKAQIEADANAARAFLGN